MSAGNCSVFPESGTQCRTACSSPDCCADGMEPDLGTLRPARGHARTGLARPASVHAMLCVLCCLALTLLAACQGRVPADSPLIEPDSMTVQQQGRVSPVHEQWLYRQSMLAQTNSLIQSMPARLLWRNAAYAQNAGLVRSRASVWAVASRDMTFTGLGAALSGLASLGVQGVWLGDIREKDLAWVADPDADTGPSQRTASFAPDQRHGSSEELKTLLADMERLGLQSGMSLVPAATGLGPDFMLQARGSARQEGLYILFDVPAQYWQQLPKSSGPWDVHALSAAAVSSLRAQKLLPGPLLQDSFAAPCGYAATGEVLGLDGQTRRYVYRYHGSPLQPVLDWQHPSGQARSLLSASAIQTTGVWRQTLAGLALSPLAGLDPASAAQTDPLMRCEPALMAYADLSGLVHRCGGWSLALQPLSPAMAAAAQKSCDFVMAPDFARLLEEALRTEDATALHHCLTSLAREPGLSLANLVFATPGLTEADILKSLPAGTQDKRKLATRTAHLLLALPAGLPGLCFLDAGLLQQTRGRASESAEAALLLTQALEARTRLDLGSGRLVKTLLPAKSVLVTIVSLPGGGYLVTALNFSSRPVRVEVATGTATGTPACLTPQVQPAAPSSPTSFALSLKARQAAHMIAGPGLSAHAQGTAYGQANEQ